MIYAKIVTKLGDLTVPYLLNFSKTKSHKEVTTQEESRFFLLFCLMKEGSGSEAGSVPRTNGSGSGRSKTYGSGSATLSITVSYHCRRVLPA